ncbi:Signal recognition particle subunit SRP68 [Trypanosoma melophagium]|uniref:Signal recognition particle subunit SRP68 n=1 Tax=Trypanosoma melophagium TaxID=715481 RepID=UPI00351A28BD|nr:Signal recognition particle subunit SRP68 [Trypanosoma melophagium]
MDFDLSLLLKEIQLQHGLRAEDYARYHRYTTNRLSTLRHQLGLVQDAKKFHQREITPLNATRPEYLQLLVLSAERCWASAEELQEKRRTAERSGENKPSGGVPPNDQFRKRLNKSVKWAVKLHTVAKAVASERLQKETEAYMLEVKGRAAVAHSLMSEAKEFFLASREKYYELRNCSTPEQWTLLFTKVNELDDRVTYCMLRLGEDVTSYKPHIDLQDPSQQLAATTIEWNGRKLNVASIKVKDALREARALNVDGAKAKAMELNGPIPVGQQNKVLDLMDRRIGCLNDALSHARQDLRTLVNDRQKTELQLLVHYLLFQVSYETLQRTLFMVEIYVRRFRATERSLSSSSSSSSGNGGSSNNNSGSRSKKEIPPSQYASPLEIVRLYDAALETLGEMELLPGVSGRVDVEELLVLCRAGKLLYLGEGWRISKDFVKAQNCYKASLSILEDATSVPQVEALRLIVQKSSLQLASAMLLTTLPYGTTTGKDMRKKKNDDNHGGDDKKDRDINAKPLEYLVDAGDGVTIAQNIIKFPPEYQAVPCKPVFVDIASTYIDYPMLPSASQGEQEQRGGTDDGKKERLWKWGWGWRK